MTSLNAWGRPEEAWHTATQLCSLIGPSRIYFTPTPRPVGTTPFQSLPWKSGGTEGQGMCPSWWQAPKRRGKSKPKALPRANQEASLLSSLSAAPSHDPTPGSTFSGVGGVVGRREGSPWVPGEWMILPSAEPEKQQRPISLSQPSPILCFLN